MDFGRCFTLTPSDDYTKYGIKKIGLRILVNSTIFIHSAGIVQTGSRQIMSEQYVELRKRYNFFFNWRFYDLLDYGGGICNNDKNYSKDLCVDKAVEKESIDKSGCTTPFGPDKTKICMEKEKSKNVSLIYDKAFNMAHYEECWNPCSFSAITTTTFDVFNAKWSLNTAIVYLNFEEIIKVTNSYYIYSGLSLIAEIGGYVGLFLGVSINQITHLVDFLLAKLKQLYA